MPDQAKDKPKEEQKPLPKPKKKASKKKFYWVRTTYVKGSGVHVMGSEVSEAARKAWNKHTPVSIDSFISDSLPEKEKTDKEKLAAYDALKKE